MVVGCLGWDVTRRAWLTPFGHHTYTPRAPSAMASLVEFRYELVLPCFRDRIERGARLTFVVIASASQC